MDANSIMLKSDKIYWQYIVNYFNKSNTETTIIKIIIMND